MRDKKVKILGVGLNKTGTTSVTKALDILGYKCLHNHELITAKYRNNELPGLIDKYDFLCDGFCYTHMLQFLSENYPDAVFLCTQRPMEDWIISRTIHDLHARVCWPIVGRNRHIDTKMYEEIFYQHQQDIQTYLIDKGRNVFDLIVPQLNWKVLCDIFDKPIPKQKFPHGNTGEYKLKQIIKKRSENGK
jgi:hypothetical protein